MPEKTVVEILSGALEIWGPNGKNWCRRTIEDDYGSTCLIGGLTKAANGYATYNYGMMNNVYLTEELLCNELGLNPRSYGGGAEWALINFNDNKDFDQVRKAVCGALKKAIEAEAPHE